MRGKVARRIRRKANFVPSDKRHYDYLKHIGGYVSTSWRQWYQMFKRSYMEGTLKETGKNRTLNLKGG